MFTRIGRGMTLVELIVVIAIIGILVGLSLSGINAARQASRRLSCQNNLKQLTLGLIQYESAHKTLPAGTIPSPWNNAILPYLDLQTVFPSADGSYRPRNFPSSVPLFECPSDDPNDGKRFFYTNYFGNSGVQLTETGFDGVFTMGRIAIENESHDKIRFADITDGLSNTALLAEGIHGNPASSRLSTAWHLPGRGYAPDELDAFVAACNSLPIRPKDHGFMGDPQLKGKLWNRDPTYGIMGPNVGVMLKLYNHASAPNTPSCMNGTSIVTGTCPATSYHNHVINVSLCDGSVQAIADTISLEAWRSMGTRADFQSR